MNIVLLIAVAIGGAIAGLLIARFARGAASDPAAAVLGFQKQLRQHSAKAAFMKGMKTLVGVEFGEMANALFEPAPVEGRVFTLAQLKQKVDDIARLPAAEFAALKRRRDIDRALPRLVVAATLTEDFGYSRLQLTERELGSGLIHRIPQMTSLTSCVCR